MPTHASCRSQRGVTPTRYVRRTWRDGAHHSVAALGRHRSALPDDAVDIRPIHPELTIAITVVVVLDIEVEASDRWSVRRRRIPHLQGHDPEVTAAQPGRHGGLSGGP